LRAEAIVTQQEKERVNWLCEQIQTEKDPAKFTNLMTELNDMLELKNVNLWKTPQAQSR
jgi:hypothetical protein